MSSRTNNYNKQWIKASLVGPVLLAGERAPTAMCYGALETEDANGAKCLYSIPYDARSVIKFNIATHETTYIPFTGDFGRGMYNFDGGVLGLDGCIYAAPLFGEYILKINPKSDKATPVGNNLGEGTMGWSGAVCDPNTGFIYFAPYNASYILCLDPITQSTFRIGSDLGNGNFKHSGGVILHNMIYFAPYYSPQVLAFNIQTGVTQMIDSEYQGTAKWCGGAPHNNRYIYFFPCSASCFLKLDTETGVTSCVGDDFRLTSFGHYGGTKGTDGKFYLGPCNAKHIVQFDPQSETLITITSSDVNVDLKGPCQWAYPTTASDGNIYAFPTGASNILQIKTRNNWIFLKHRLLVEQRRAVRKIIQFNDDINTIQHFIIHTNDDIFRTVLEML